jgi:excisionase family DNA binding protein
MGHFGNGTMSQSSYVTVREASQILGIPEGKIMQMVSDRQLTSYKIADQYLRLKRADVLALRNTGSIAVENTKFPYTFQERLRDFLTYNDFYILSFLVILGLLALIFFFG